MKPTLQSVLSSLKEIRILPILVVDDIDLAINCVTTLAEQGLSAVEITFRTPNALNVLREVIKACPDVIIGAGTVLTQQQLEAAAEAGAAFALSPGITPQLAHAVACSRLPFIPGVSHASDLMLAMEYGFDVVKLFPADLLGGSRLVKALAGPFPDVRFCLTGGITIETMPHMLALPSVMCVGGSWMCTADLIDAKNWSRIGALAAQAATAARDSSPDKLSRPLIV
ncbi:MAG TPA: bifunctional 4-hydroxy-2-oxoglutarate aldolase/2-dehydro-3-deoxy-phosphogluconate aldolase [Burkholderiaceae bacterium]|jgi:2-dehydro-3-deoxyphosphogluconate aldolase/(4S)-4-hydroxy-2-oxoglutarate aldolase